MKARMDEASGAQKLPLSPEFATNILYCFYKIDVGWIATRMNTERNVFRNWTYKGFALELMNHLSNLA